MTGRPNKTDAAMNIAASDVIERIVLYLSSTIF